MKHRNMGTAASCDGRSLFLCPVSIGTVKKAGQRTKRLKIFYVLKPQKKESLFSPFESLLVSVDS